MSQISRDPQELVEHAMGGNHQYPDGMMLFCGTMFAPTKDRGTEGAGFTHHLDDDVYISTGKLGCLANRVGLSDKLRSEEHTSELQSLMRTSYAVFSLK